VLVRTDDRGHEQIVWYDKAWVADNGFFSQLELLEAFLERPGYLNSIIEAIEKLLQGNIKTLKLSHDNLMIEVIRELYEKEVLKRARASIFVEAPLGFKILQKEAEKLYEEFYRKFNESTEKVFEMLLGACSLRVDILVIYDPGKPLTPGLYFCRRGRGRNVHRLEYILRKHFKNVKSIDTKMLYKNKDSIKGKNATIIEVKTKKVDECVIGQLITYERLLKEDFEVQNINKIIAIPKGSEHSINPVIREVFNTLKIEIKLVQHRT